MKFKIGWIIINVSVEEVFSKENLSIDLLDPTMNNPEKMNNDEFELIQLALIHLSSANRRFLHVIFFFLVQCVRNKQFCSNDTNRIRVRNIQRNDKLDWSTFFFAKIYRSFTKLITINHDENIPLVHIFDCFVESYGKLFEISMETKKIVSRRLTKAKKENKVKPMPACPSSSQAFHFF